MKIETHIFIDRETFVSQADYDMAAKLAGVEGKPFAFNFRAASDSKQMEALLDFLKSKGKQPRRASSGKTSDEFYLRYQRIYERTDIEAAELLNLRPIQTVGSACAEDPLQFVHTEKVIFDKTRLKNLRRIQQTLDSGRPGIYSCRLDSVVITEGFRKIIKGRCLAGPRFDLVIIKSRSAEEISTSIWSLRSEIILPPMSLECEFIDGHGNPFNGDPATTCILREGFFESAEMHYRKCDLDMLGAFDVGLTKESFGGHESAYRALVVSQRFRDLCEELSLSVEWQPVRVDL